VGKQTQIGSSSTSSHAISSSEFRIVVRSVPQPIVIVEAWLARSGHFITVNAVALNGRDNQAEEPLAVPERRSAMEYRIRVSTLAPRPVHAATRQRTNRGRRRRGRSHTLLYVRWRESERTLLGATSVIS
jgi:hypothetical protein